MTTGRSTHNIHGNCVSFRGNGVLVVGAAGSGKSGLSLQLMALGAELVADDRTDLWRDGDALWANAPAATKGLVEARGIGILQAQTAGPVPVRLIIDLDRTETDRMPEIHRRRIHRIEIPLLYKIDAPYFPAAIVQYLKGGRLDT